MNEEIFLVVALVRYLKLSKGYITDRRVEKIIRKVRPLEALDLNIRLLIEHLRYMSAYFVQLHTVKAACAHAFGQSPEEIAHAAGGLQDIAALES